MIEAGQDLFSRHGYGITLLQVIDQADTPRGSIYYHFRDGKEELAIEVMSKVAAELEKFVALLGKRKAKPTDFLQALVDHHTKRLVGSEYREGCPIAGVTVSSNDESDELKRAIDDTFTRWISAIRAVLVDKGFTLSSAEQVAATVTSGIEGALLIGRATRSDRHFQYLRASIPYLVSGAIAEASAPS